MRAARRMIALMGCFAAAALGSPQGVPDRILIIPLDDRPAPSHFAQMIGDMAGVQVELPPRELLGKFTQPGSPEALLQWLERQGLQNYDAVVLSTDMLAYGSLIASRADRTGYNLAIRRLREFWRLKKSAPNTKVYAFSAIMRMAPTATRSTAAWRLQLAKYAEVKERYRTSPSRDLLNSLRNLQAKIPPQEIVRYEETRQRNLKVQQELVRMTGQGVFQYLILGQDDAQPVGPHVPETARLAQMVQNLYLDGKVYFSEGIDQHSNVLVSRALMASARWTPRIRIVFADDEGRSKIALYETEPVENSLKDQIVASGARPARSGESFDYSLYVNTPEPRPNQFEGFVKALKAEVDQGFPVAVADINLGKTGTGDPQLYEALLEGGRSTRLLGYAGWNTAGNTMGTTIPAANVYLLARRLGVDPFKREIARRTFLLHRLVNDFEYHKNVRPQAYALIDSMPAASREETYGEEFYRVDNYVRQDLGKRLQERFNQQMVGTRFFAGPKQYEVVALKAVKIALPWPRAYEVRLDFAIEASEVTLGLPPTTSAQAAPSRLP